VHSRNQDRGSRDHARGPASAGEHNSIGSERAG
jgi:hypothetical protein